MDKKLELAVQFLGELHGIRDVEPLMVVAELQKRRVDRVDERTAALNFPELNRKLARLAELERENAQLRRRLELVPPKMDLIAVEVSSYTKELLERGIVQAMLEDRVYELARRGA